MLLTDAQKRNLGRGLRRARNRVYAKIAVVAAAGMWFAVTGPFALAPVLWAGATVMYWRRGVSVLEYLRDTPEAWPVLYAGSLPEAKLQTDKHE